MFIVFWGPNDPIGVVLDVHASRPSTRQKFELYFFLPTAADSCSARAHLPRQGSLGQPYRLHFALNLPCDDTLDRRRSCLL